MNNLGGWLLEQIAADEAEAPMALGPCDCDVEGFPLLHGVRCIVPFLADRAAKRRIVEHVKEQWDAAYGEPDLFLPREWETVLRLLAQPYADRPGWRQEWTL